MKMFKYPRTTHIQGSRLQPGDEDLSQVPLSSLVGKYLVIEEKVDGANAGISFDLDGTMLLQSRGHYLTGGYRERHFARLKTWAMCHYNRLYEILGRRYIMYGEWCYAKHTVFYDRLPHYFLEFDIFDREKLVFLDTATRQEMLAGSPIVSVPVLSQGILEKKLNVADLVVHSLYKSAAWRTSLAEAAAGAGVDPDLAARETDDHDKSEGLYIKVEAEGLVVDRHKWVRHTFMNAILDSGSHWLDRPVIANRLAPEVDIYAP